MNEQQLVECFVNALERVTLRLDRIEHLLYRIHSLEKHMTASITDLQAAVAAEDTVIASAATLINGIAARVAAAGTDPVALQAVIDDVNGQAASLAAAVAANTPAAPTAGTGATGATGAAS